MGSAIIPSSVLDALNAFWVVAFACRADVPGSIACQAVHRSPLNPYSGIGGEGQFPQLAEGIACVGTAIPV